MTQQRPPFPRSIKHYELSRLLGQGGMGLVVEGTDRRDGSKVAVKLLYQHLAASDPSFLDRFEREAHVGALLRSPYTVHLLDYGSQDGQPFLVMEFVDGESLAAVINRGPLDTPTALRVASEVGRALEEADARGIVHRDIKPENVLIDRAGRVKVTDFGIARSSTASGMTVTGGFVGTPAFAAPEQIDGKVDHRSDIYALGVTLYNMLSGQPPFRGKSAMDTLFQHRTTPLPMAPIAHLPDSVQNIVRRCLEKDPLDRYQNASELVGALDRAQQTLSRASIPPAPAGLRPEPNEVPSFPPARPSFRETESLAGVAPPVVPAVSRVTPAAAQPVPAEALTSQVPPPRKKRSSKPILLAVLGGGLAAAGLVVAIALLGGGGDDDPPADGDASPSAAISETGTATATTETATATTDAGGSPTAEPTSGRLPSVTPPVPASRLTSGDGAIVTAEGVAVNIWRNPSEGSSDNEVLATLFAGEGVIVVTNSPPEATVLVTEGLVFWRVLVPGTTTVGWVKEVVVGDETLRYLERAETHQVGNGETCASIALAAGVTLEAFLAVNQLDESSCTRITIGSLLVIPKS